MGKKINLWISLFIIGAIVIAVSLSIPYLFSCTSYRCIHFPNQQNWSLKEEYEHTDKIWRGMLFYADQLLRIEIIHNVTPHEAQVFTNSRFARIQGLYDTALSPYPDAISHIIRCDEIYKPKQKILHAVDASTIAYFSASLNGRMQYGACVDNQIVYNSSVGMMYCEDEQKWIQIELITDKNSALSFSQREDFIRAVSCSGK